MENVQHSQKLNTCCCTQPHKFSPLLPIRFLQDTLSFYLPPRLGFPSGLLVSGFPTKIIYAFLFPSPHDACPTRLLPDQIYVITFELHPSNSPLCSFIQFPITVLGPDVFLVSLFCNFPTQERPSFTPVQASKQIYAFVHINLYFFRYRKLVHKRCCTKWQQAFPEFNYLLFFCINFDLCLSQNLYFVHFQRMHQLSFDCNFVRNSINTKIYIAFPLLLLLFVEELLYFFLLSRSSFIRHLPN